MKIVSTILRLPFAVYRYLVSPAIHLVSGSNYGCRYSPTCSHYAEEAFQTHGPLRAAALSLWRVLRCGPWCEGGYDPVPHAIGNPHSIP